MKRRETLWKRTATSWGTFSTTSAYCTACPKPWSFQVPLGRERPSDRRRCKSTPGRRDSRAWKSCLSRTPSGASTALRPRQMAPIPQFIFGGHQLKMKMVLTIIIRRLKDETEQQNCDHCRRTGTGNRRHRNGNTRRNGTDRRDGHGGCEV